MTARGRFRRAWREPSGFTLLELIIVIAIIAVLAALALPRLIETQRDARIAKAMALHGSLRSAAALARARCELDLGISTPPTGPDCRNTPPAVLMDGHPVRIVNRFPAAAADGIDVAADIDMAVGGLVASNGTATNSSSISVPSRSFDIVGGTVPNCRVTYLEAGLNGSTVVAPEFSVTTSGC
jgi:MSHA pilin protein MshA